MTIATLPVTLENLTFIAWVGLHRLRIRFSSNTHPFDPRFISGDAFRSLANHIYEPSTSFDPANVKKRDIVFVSSIVIKEFFEKIHPQIPVPYRLITHNGDTNIDESFRKYVDKKIIRWWAQNCLVTHPKIVPIPIGLENLSYYNHGIPALYAARKMSKRKAIVLYGFSVSTNKKIRSKALSFFKKYPLARPVVARLNSAQYVKLLDSYQFVASPPGNGEDCIRSWEAMYRGVVPIVLKSNLTSYFSSLHLPVWVIDDWRYLQKYSENDLRRKYKEIYQRANGTALGFAYWKDQILTTYGR